ncbi:MFS transporter, FHS family, L-fucose permease [Tenacibaculum sp. MAR_2009_124]|uniref:sugar MFS transporter n=1 Tax=Tenacibaculum sp. MAR_2009_124 TaxID=1250059 RepID=UPI00089B6FC1|nr:sugar MFS transporter [Tenacibaculum sp. MAR_2009_124]SEB38688.1 MFS transporter, FHS family, L-fucose permease [Tenacibaculum sp. MAR_2009_124]
MTTPTNKSYTKAFIFLTSLFFLWGFITVLVDSLIPRIRELFTLSYFQAGLVQFAFFGAYFLLSIPAGYILARIGYKKGIILGLSTMAVGCLLFYPAASYRVFGVFMLAYFVLAGGITILQVAANPYVAVLGSEEGASSRLNLSQAFNSLGTAIAPAIGAMLILSDKVKSNDEIAALSETVKEQYLLAEAEAVQTPFIGIAGFIVVLALVFVFVKLPKLLEKVPNGGYAELLQNKSLMMGAVGIFVYVGAEVAIGSYLVNYFMDMNLFEAIKNNSFMRGISETLLNADLATVDNKAIVGAFVTFYWSGAMIGRFIGAYLTKIIAPAKVLMSFAIGALVLIVISMNTSGFVAMWTILAVGLFNSIMFPTIFTLAIDGLDDLKPQASGILCTMIVGGAIIPPLYGLLTDNIGFKLAFVLVILCYGYIWFYGKSKVKK